MILFVILLTIGLTATASAQSCSVATSGSLNGLCPTGYTLIPSGCCPSDCVVTATTASTCFDKLNPDTGKSDCPGMKGYCTNSAYLSLMKEQCPLTCGYCTGTATTTKPSTCADIRNPRTGENECPGMAAYCRNSAYLSFMREQCPKTCGYC